MNLTYQHLHDLLLVHFNFTFVEETPDKVVVEKDCEIGGHLIVTFTSKNGRDILQFKKKMAGEEVARYAQFKPTTFEQMYGAIAIMENLV